MENKEQMEEWVEANIALHRALEKLEELDKEREEIFNKLEKTPLPELKKQMDESIKKYEALLKKIKELKNAL